MSSSAQQIFNDEVKLRGTIITMSADMEFLLLKIMLICIIDNPIPKIRKFKKMLMSKKIEYAKKDLENYFPIEYKKCESDFLELEQINELRNHMAHDNMNRSDLSSNKPYVEFVFIDIIDDQHRLLTKRYDIIEVNKTILRFREIMMKINTLCQLIEEDFLNRYPDFKSLSKA